MKKKYSESRILFCFGGKSNGYGLVIAGRSPNPLEPAQSNELFMMKTIYKQVDHPERDAEALDRAFAILFEEAWKIYTKNRNREKNKTSEN